MRALFNVPRLSRCAHQLQDYPILIVYVLRPDAELLEIHIA
jgi:hypothetical protein